MKPSFVASPALFAWARDLGRSSFAWLGRRRDVLRLRRDVLRLRGDVPRLRRALEWLGRIAPAPGDLLRDATYRRLWTSILLSSFGGQLTMLALPLTAAVLLNASPSQMGLLTAFESLPFALFALPTGVWLDRVRKLRVYVAGESALALVVASVPLAWWLDWLSMRWLYLVAFAIGIVQTTAGSAAQIVLTQIVPRARLVEAHAKNALASSTSEVAGPGAAGVLIELVGAPLTLLGDGLLLVFSALILRRIRIDETARGDDSKRAAQRFWHALREGLRFVLRNRLLVTMAAAVGVWQMCQNAALAVQILFATRLLGLSEHAVGLCYVAVGAGTIIASAIGHRVTQRLGGGPALVAGFALSGAGWLLLALAPASRLGVAALVLMLMLFGVGAVFIFINFLSLRQSVTPPALLGRMTSTMRWLILLPAVPGALLGGWLGEHFGLRVPLALAGLATLTMAAVAARLPVIRAATVMPHCGLIRSPKAS